MSHEWDVIVAGEVYIDLVLSGFDAWPQLGQESFAKQFHREVGGGTAITARGLASLGLRTAVLAAVGCEDGRWVLDRLSSYGVNTSRVSYEASEPTGFSVVATIAADRAFLSYAGANRLFADALRAAVETSQFTEFRHLHLAYAPSLDEASGLFDNIRANGCTISLDTGWHPSWLDDPRAVDAIRRVDLYFPNEMEARRLTRKSEPDEILEEFDRMGIRQAALKLGPNGSALLSNGTVIFADVPAVNPIDTTGAGDCFDAGFLASWLSGEEPSECLSAGNICGALSTEHYGGLSGFPTRQELRLRMERIKK